MKYQVHIEIDLPLDRVVELFDNPANMKHWMPKLQSIEPISGSPGQVGATSRMKFLNGKREMEMTETITAKNLPHEFSGTYEFQGGRYSVKNMFEALDGGRTRYISDQDFQLAGLMKFLGWVLPGLFKKESMKHMTLFKKFAESQGPN